MAEEEEEVQTTRAWSIQIYSFINKFQLLVHSAKSLILKDVFFYEKFFPDMYQIIDFIQCKNTLLYGKL